MAIPTNPSRTSLLLGGGIALSHSWTTGWITSPLLALSAAAGLPGLAIDPASALVLREPFFKAAASVRHPCHYFPSFAADFRWATISTRRLIFSACSGS